MNIISLSDAKASGLKNYFTGKPCKHGHVDFRSVSNGTCVECQRIKAVSYYQKNRELRIKRRMENYLANKDRQTEKMRAYYIANRDSAREKRIQRYHSDAENARLNSRRWAKENIEYRRANHAERRAAKRNATPSWLTMDHRKQISAVYRQSRELELETGTKHHVDHIVPLSSKLVCGLHVPWNLRAIPAGENMKKSNKVAE